MARKKTRTIIPPEVGANATFSDWIGGWIEIRVEGLSDSPAYGVCVEGIEVDGGKYRALPLSRMVEEGHATRIGHGKWDVEMPDGKVSHLKSKKAAIKFCLDRGVVFTEI